MYIADTWSHTIRKVTVATGIINTIAGIGTDSYSGDGGPATSAALNYPWAVALDSVGKYQSYSFIRCQSLFICFATGNVYIADSRNNLIRKVTVSTGIISTITSAVYSPYGVGLDSAGNVYIADSGTNYIRKVTVSTGVVSTIAGTGGQGYSGDGGPATAAELYSPTGVAVDSSGKDTP